MQGWVRVLPLLTAALAATIPPAPQDAWSRQELLDLFNERTEADYLYRLVETGASNDPTRPRRLPFMMKETECQKSAMKKNTDCKFKEGGHKRQDYGMAATYCGGRAGCFSSIGHVEPVHKVPGLSDLIKKVSEGITGNFGGVAEFHTTPGRSQTHDSALDEDANFQPVEAIDQTYGGISFGDSDQDKEDFGIVKENRSPGVDLPNKARTRSRRAPWSCFLRPGCRSIIGSFDQLPTATKLFPSLVQDPGIIRGLDWDLDKTHSQHIHRRWNKESGIH